MCDTNSILKILDNYPLISDFTEGNSETPLLIKLMTTIFYLREKIGYVIEGEPIFNDYTNINISVFEDIDKEELQNILKYVVFITCVYVSESDFIENEDKTKICGTIIKLSE